MAVLLTRAPGHEVALTDDTGTRTWAQLSERADRWAAGLRGAGLRTGDRVALVAGNRCETYEALLGCVHAGLVAVPVNWRLKPDEISYILTDCEAAAVVTEPRYAATVARAAAGTAVRARVCMEESAGFATIDDLPALEAGPVCGATLLYTSGTSGRPKGVVTARLEPGAPIERAAATADALGRRLDLPQRGRVLLAGPWYHSAQLFFTLYPLLRGCSVVMRRAFDAAGTPALIDRERITICHLVPTQFIRMLRERDRRPFSGATLERVWHGGAPCPPDVKRAMIDWWGPVFREYYAATESGIIAQIDSEEWLKRPGSVGRPLPGGEIVILDEEGHRAPPGVVGRVGIPGRGFHYHRAPDKTAAAYIAPGVFTVGDVGYLDEDGYLFLTARSADIIITGGVNVYPAEVEAALLAHPAVRDAVVFGVPEPEFGEQVKALVEREPGVEVSAGDLEAHCRARLAGFKIPRSYEFVTSLPREPTGKLARYRVRAPYWARTGRSI